MNQREILANKWARLEDRSQQITKMLDELDAIEFEFEEVNLKSTTIYIVLQKELELINKEQLFIDKLS